MKITHNVQFAEIELANRLGSIESFCRIGHSMLKTSCEVYDVIRAEARKRDLDEWGDIPESETYYEGEEIEVAYVQYPYVEALELVGLFSLVYVVSALEKYFDDVLESCGWTIEFSKKKCGNNRAARALKKIETEVKKELLDKREHELFKEVIKARNEFVHNRGFQKKAKRFARDGRIVFTHENSIDVVGKMETISTRITEACKPYSTEIGR